jgi:outer membrane protein assembly factor BamB
MRHVIDYSLAEWDLRFFESGLVRQYADYVVACGDNRQWPAGFGDSGYSITPSLATAALPMAFWWTRDGAYRRVLEQALPKGWKNPFWPEVESAPAERFVGLNVLPLDRQIYDDTQKRPTYNEAFARAEVPFEQAWDKISFRENWDPAGQYLLLDGIGRGKHLHFDTSSITTFVQDGERWLLDHDYLVRNTTEHSMLSVLRGGRCGVLVPSLAGLTAAGETPAMAAMHAYVKGYNGVDWERQVLWRKGQWFLVRDTVTAREAGAYDLDLTWKTIDRGNQKVDGEGRFTARRGGAHESSGLAAIDDPAAGNGQAAVFGEPSSRLVFALPLDAGEWEIDVIGYGLDGSTDSVFVSLDGGANVAAHLPQHSYGPSRTQYEQGSGVPKLNVGNGGRHVVVVTLRENPPVRLDRLEFRREGVGPVVIQAEAAPPVQPGDAPALPVLALHIDPADRPLAWVTNHVRQGISVPVSILHQRHAAELQPGESSAWCSLVYATGPAQPAEFALQPLGPNTYRVTGPQGAVAAGFGSAAVGPVHCAAAGWLLQPDAVHLVAPREVTAGPACITFGPATAASLDLNAGTLAIRATGPSRVDARGCQLRASAEAAAVDGLALPPGDHRLVVVGLDRAPFAEAARLVPPPPAAGPALASAKPPAWTPQWSLRLGDGKPVARITPADLDGDGTDEFLVACGYAGYAVSADGALRWTHQTGGAVRDVALAHFARGGPGTVLVSSADTYLYQLDPAGAQTRKDQMTGIYFSADHGVRPWGVYCTRGVDSDADGADDLLVTTLASMETQGLGPDASKRWRHLSAYHGCMELAVQDLDLDGKPEIAIANKYGAVYVLRPDGTALLGSNTSIGDVTFGLGDLDRDGKPEIVHGSSTGDLIAVDLKGKILWRFDNYGYPVERILCTDTDGDGRTEVLVASGTGYLYCLGQDGTRRWEQRLGLAVHDVVVAGGAIVAGTEDGVLHALDAAGKTLWSKDAGAAVLKLASGRGSGAAHVVAGLADGRLAAVAAK